MACNCEATRTEYQNFFALCKDADPNPNPNIPVCREAKVEYPRLRPFSGLPAGHSLGKLWAKTS